MTIFEMAREHAVVGSIASTLSWDQETMMPRNATAHRAGQIAWLAARAHEIATSPAWLKALEAAEATDRGEDAKLSANLHRLRLDFERASRLPTGLVARWSSATSHAKRAWADARQNADFAAFAPHLETLVGLAREKAELWGYQDEPYDALLECYERGTSTAAVAALFDALEPRLRSIARRAVEKSAARRPSLPPGPYPVSQQQAFNAQVAAAVGIDFDAARIDTSTHPFCTNLGPGDQRLTTRYDEEDFTSSFFGVLHEAGHGLYEMGLPHADYGLPSGTSLSLGIHESQSRLWENQVGRSESFWRHWYPVACQHFPQLDALPLEEFMAYIHRAEFSPYRVEADEATYDLHILLRFSLERQLLAGQLKVADIPEAWNAGFEERFGLRPANDREGCLQDIHWSMGGIGYFPTYTLGNLNAAQLFAAASADPQVAEGLAQARYAPLLRWLREKIHSQGALPEPAQLIEAASGKPPGADDYLHHLESRHA